MRDAVTAPGGAGAAGAGNPGAAAGGGRGGGGERRREGDPVEQSDEAAEAVEDQGQERGEQRVPLRVSGYGGVDAVQVRAERGGRGVSY